MRSSRTRLKISVHYILNALSYMLVLSAGMSFMLSNVSIIPSPLGIIVSKSMTPLMMIGDIVFLEPVALQDVKVGDLIAFSSPPEKVIIHRVVEIRDYYGQKYLITKGDANPVTDQSVGYPMVTGKNYVGRVFCLEGIPLKIPSIGVYILDARNYSIWLTQNKIWSFWGPLIALLYIIGPYLSPNGMGSFNFRNSLKQKVPVKQAFTYSLIGFIAISAFTFYFKTETYTLSARVASLQDDKASAYISLGSMIYGEVRNNSIEVTGAPLFPVKTVVIVDGNATAIITPIPKTKIVEPEDWTSLIIQASIPDRGEIDPGIYRGNVHIFSETLLVFVPDEVIFGIFAVVKNPWLSLILLDALAAFGLALFLGFLAASVSFASKQLLYTLVWEDKIENRQPARIRIMLHKLNGNLSAMFQNVSGHFSRLFLTIKKDVELRRILRPSNLACVPSIVLFLILDDMLFPVLMLGVILGLAVWKFSLRERSEILASAALANLFLLAAFVGRRGVAIVYSTISFIWTIVSASFVGNINYFVTLPVVIALMMATFFGFIWMRIWYLEHQTNNWAILRPGEVEIEANLKMPSLEEFEAMERRKLNLPKFPTEIGRSMRKLKRKMTATIRSLDELRRRVYNEAYNLFLKMKKAEVRFTGKELPLIAFATVFSRFMKQLKDKLLASLEAIIIFSRIFLDRINSKIMRG